jgi:hypothetical protein
MPHEKTLQVMDERQDLGARHSTIAIVEATLEHLFPRHQNQEFFKTHRNQAFTFRHLNFNNCTLSW